MKNGLKYLKLLSKSFSTIQAASTEIINLEAILNLSKGTEHFVTDLHWEYEAFQHVLRNASGVINRIPHIPEIDIYRLFIILKKI